MAKILVVDDDAQIRSLLKITLERAGHEILMAPDGAQAIEIFNEDPADLVITDVVMPQQEGLATIRQLRKENPGVSIIAISGGGFADPEEYLEIARAFGARHTFKKPVDHDQLLDAINETLDEG
jgi:DNA-binding NtrC family response regulator